MEEGNNVRKSQHRTSESADLVRMLHLLKRFQKALDAHEPMDEKMIGLMLRSADATKNELKKLGKDDDVRICRYLIKYLQGRKDELENI